MIQAFGLKLGHAVRGYESPTESCRLLSLKRIGGSMSVEGEGKPGTL